jgi:hypothetical protein
MAEQWFQQLTQEGWNSLDKERVINVALEQSLTSYQKLVDILLNMDLRQLVKKDYGGERKAASVNFVRHKSPCSSMAMR